MTKRPYRIAAVVALAAALTLSACGSSDDEPSSSGGGLSQITVGFPTPTSDTLNYVADSKGFFEKNGVDVSIVVSNGANLPGEVASGRIDLAAHAVGVAMSLTQQGKPAKVIYALTGGGQGGTLFVNKDTKAVTDLKSGCRMGTFPAGSSAYGYAQTYIKKLGLDCEITPFQDVPSQVGALASGRVDALVGVYLNFISAVEDDQAKVLIDTRDPSVSEENLGLPYPEVSLFGSDANLKKKAKSLPGYLKAIDEAARYIKATPAATVAKDIVDQPNLKGQSLEQITGAVETLEAYRWRGSDEGRIDDSQWKAALAGVSSWGLPGYSATDSKFAYGQMVDMSYLDEAKK